MLRDDLLSGDGLRGSDEDGRFNPLPQQGRWRTEEEHE